MYPSLNHKGTWSDFLDSAAVSIYTAVGICYSFRTICWCMGDLLLATQAYSHNLSWCHTTGHHQLLSGHVYVWMLYKAIVNFLLGTTEYWQCISIFEQERWRLIGIASTQWNGLYQSYTLWMFVRSSFWWSMRFYNTINEQLIYILYSNTNCYIYIYIHVHVCSTSK